MKPKPNARPNGQIRQSQVVTTFGPGSMIDLPNLSIIVGGLEDWTEDRDEVFEPRLIEKLKRLLEIPQLKLLAPPADTGDPAGHRTGITGWQFPEWFVTQDVDPGSKGGLSRSRRLVHRKGLTKGRFFGDDRKSHSVTPLRFVRACPKGHIGDIDWYGFVHQGESQCRGRPLWIEERGTSGDLTEIVVRCDCGVRRDLAVAQKANGSIGICDGARPWLGANSREGCGIPNKLLIRSASNAYFPQVMSVISLPDKNEGLGKAVGKVWSYLEAVESTDDVRHERKKAAVKGPLTGFTDEEVWEEIQTRKGAVLEGPTKSVKQGEFEVLCSVKDTIGVDEPESNFFAQVLPKVAWNKPWMSSVERILLVHRLREVIAQVGFTRFESSSPDVEGELQVGVQRAQISREADWLPAVENRGEGVFVQFKKNAIDAWMEKTAVKERGKQLLAGFEAWKNAHPQSGRNFPGVPYYLMHTISHTLLTAVSLECGYPASSIRERVYSLETGYGILIYTGSPDAEGTLGGLVDAGRQIHRHLQAALELTKLCSNDPVCAQHDPPNPHEVRFLHGAACHGCLLVAETSCEQQNDFLDRALSVPTVDDTGAEFFTV